MTLKNIRWVILGLLSSQCLLLLNLLFGSLKPLPQLQWMDIAGEGGAAILIFAWWWVLLSSRPPGYVTNFLTGGVLLLFLGTFQDAIDEFIALPEAAHWINYLDALMLPPGMLFLTLGLYLWKDEQRVINNQLNRRELYFRDHRSVDQVTHLSGIHYLHQQLSIAIEQANTQQNPCALLLVDIDAFHKINREYGVTEGDRLLQATAELLVLNLRKQDLVCRVAGDRFAIVLPATNTTESQQILDDTLNLLNHFYFKTLLGERIHLQASGGLSSFREGQQLDQFMQNAKIALLRAKELKSQLRAA